MVDIVLKIIGIATVGTLAGCLCVSAAVATIAACRLMLSIGRKEK
jgi:hypothetical protein